MAGNCVNARRRSGRGQIRIAVELVAAVGTALVPVADAIGRQRLLRGERGGGVRLGAAARPVAVAERRRVVPPAALVIGGAEEDLVADVGMLEADADELHH